MENEIRHYTGRDIAIEERADGKKEIRYYAVLFNELSRNMGGWYERILPTAFEKTDFEEWTAKKNHDPNLILGASWAGTASYEIDGTGVLARVVVGDTTIWQDTLKEIQRGELRGASFEFNIASEGAKWISEKKDDIEVDVREINGVGKIWDLSPVIRPAYRGTMNKGIDIAKREYDQYKSAKDQQIEDSNTTVETENEIELLEMELDVIM